MIEPRMPQVMVVEDSRFIRYLLRKNLAYLEMKVAGECSQRDEALAMYQRLKPDVVLIDHSLPETNALNLTEALLGLDIYAKIVLLVPLRMAKESQSLIAMGVRAVVVKPFYPEILQSTLIEVTVGL
jgi:two-component system chemotaxis response regulator CheY